MNKENKVDDANSGSKNSKLETGGSDDEQKKEIQFNKSPIEVPTSPLHVEKLQIETTLMPIVNWWGNQRYKNFIREKVSSNPFF